MNGIAESLQVDARELSESKLPLRPRFLPELVAAKTDQGLVIDGASQLHVLWGEMAKQAISTMIVLMNGTRTVSEIAASFPHLTIQQVEESIAALCRWGLVEEGSGIPSSLDSNPETVSFLRRFKGAYDSGRSVNDVFAPLTSREVVIVTGRNHLQAAQYLSELLTNTGLVKISHTDSNIPEFLQTYVHSKKVFPVALSLDGEDEEQLAALDDLCSTAELPWLRVVLNTRSGLADVGPFFDRSKSPCYRCFVATHGRTQAAAGGAQDILDETAKFWICMAAAEVTYRLTGVGAPRPEGWFRRYNLQDWSLRPLSFPMIPGCAHCRSFPVSADNRPPHPDAPIDTALVFEDYVSNRSVPLFRTGAATDDPHALHELTQQTKRLSNCYQQTLPAILPELNVPLLDSSVVPSPNSLGLNELAALLKITAGIRRVAHKTGMLKRWAATAGNLGSVELFVAVRSVEGVVPGYYFYQPREHSLASFWRHTGSLAVEDFMLRAIGRTSDTLPDALILFTGAYHRVAGKYGAFAYRLINLDAGVAVSQLRMIAAALGLSSQIAPRWADDLIEDQMSLEPMAEQSTAVVSLWSKHTQNRCRPEFNSMAPRANIRPTTRARDFCDLSVSDVVRILYLESRIHEKELHGTPAVVLGSFRAQDRIAAHGVPLPAPLQNRTSLGDLLKARRSVRHYKNDPLPLAYLSTMLAFARRADAQEWSEENQNGECLKFVVLAQHVEDLEPGVYAYDPAANSLLSVRNALHADELANLYVQQEFALAPVAIWITGDLAAASARHGAFGHRQLLLRAGAAGNRLWMAAMGMGLGGTLIAGLTASARNTLQLGGFQRLGLLAVAVGYPAHNIIGVDAISVNLHPETQAHSE